MTDKSIDIDRMMEIFNHIAMREGFNLVVNEINPMDFFSSKEKFYTMMDRMIDYYIETEEYEKCSILVEVKKQNGYTDPEDEKVFSK